MIRDSGGDCPAITVIALCFNHERFVLDCLESIRQQTFKSFELIITDDQSSDNSVAVIENWISGCELSCLFIKHSTNRGLCKTLNEALAHAKGRYLAIIATDDVWLPEKLEIQLAEMERCPPTVGVLYSDAYQIDEHGDLIEGMFIASHRPEVGFPEGRILDLLAEGNFIPAMSPLIRMECFRSVGDYDESLVFEDWDMWLRIAARFDYRFSTYASAKYRILQTSMMRTVLSGSNPAKLNTFFRIKTKCIESGGLRSDLAERYRKQIWEIAYELYVLGFKGSAERMMRVYRNTGRKRALLLGVGALLGISHRSAQAIRSTLIRRTRWILK